MQDIFIEYLVKRRSTAKTALLRALIILGAVLVAAAAMLGLPGPLSFLSPVLAIGAIYGAYYLITGMNVEYEYSVTNGELDVDQIVAQRKRKRLVSVNCKEAEAFGRYKAEEHNGKGYQTSIFACDDPRNPDLWYAVIRLQKSGQTLVVFNANQKMLDAIRPFLPRLIQHQAFRMGN